MKRIAIAIGALAALAMLRDPSWAGGVASGLRAWEEDPPGMRFRWSAGRASFFIPSEAATMVLPLRTEFAGPAGSPVEVQVFSDGRWVAAVQLPELHVWVRTVLPVRARTTRRYRRIDLHVNRVVPPFMLGVMVGEVEVKP